MKGKFQKNGAVKRILAMLLTVALLAAVVNPVTSEAKTKNKTITLKATYVATSLTESYIRKSCKKVKTGINYKVKLKQYMAYSYGGVMKFTAPKTKTYAFKLNNVKHPNKGAITQGTMTFYTPSGYDKLQYVYVKTRGVKTEKLSVAAKKYTPTYYDDQNYYTSRTGYVKLQKGQTVYMVMDMSTMTFTKKPISVNLNIK